MPVCDPARYFYPAEPRYYSRETSLASETRFSTFSVIRGLRDYRPKEALIPENKANRNSQMKVPNGSEDVRFSVEK